MQDVIFAEDIVKTGMVKDGVKTKERVEPREEKMIVKSGAESEERKTDGRSHRMEE